MTPCLSSNNSVALVRALHALDTSRLADAATERAWIDVVTERRRAAINELTTGGSAGNRDRRLRSNPCSTRQSRQTGPSLGWVVHGRSRSLTMCSVRQPATVCEIEALIDFGDARIGAREYEWMPLWLGFVARDAVLARAFLNAYDTGLIDDPDFPMRAIAWTVLHDFGVDALTQLWRERGQPAPIESIGALQELLCPASILR